MPALRNANVVAQRIQIRFPLAANGNVVGMVNGLERVVSTNGFHEGVQVGETVFDNFHPEGMPVQQWVDAYDAIGPKIGTVVQGVQE